MQVPFLDLKHIHAPLAPELLKAAKDVIKSSCYIGGPHVENFEAAFARYTHAAHAMGTGNGLDALTLSLKAAGIGPGDKVLVPSNTYIATWFAVTHVGAIPLPVEPSPDLYTVEAEQFMRAYTPDVKALIPVHLYGHSCDMKAIAKWAQEKDLVIVEDAAQAHGTLCHGLPVGQYAHFTCWSFYPGKNLGALGDGGMVTVHDATLAEKIRILRNYGSPEKYVNTAIGYNSRLDPLQAAMLSCKLPLLDGWNARRAEIASTYTQELVQTSLICPQTASWCTPVWHLYVVQHPQRDALQQKLAEHGIQTLIHYPIPPYLQQAYNHLSFDRSALERTEAEAQRILSLPMGPHLSDEQVEYTISCLKKCLKKLG